MFTILDIRMTGFLLSPFCSTPDSMVQRAGASKRKKLQPIMEDIAKKLISDHTSKVLNRHVLQAASIFDLAAACQALDL